MSENENERRADRGDSGCAGVAEETPVEAEAPAEEPEAAAEEPESSCRGGSLSAEAAAEEPEPGEEPAAEEANR